MMTKTLYLASSVLLATLLIPAMAQARLESCGGVFLSGEASCEFVREQDCETRCEVTSVETSCVATVQTECESSCSASAETECNETCTPVCVE